jgi:hypothetical protein
MKTVLALASILSLGLCLAAPVLFFLDAMSEANFKLVLLLASLAWFCLAVPWASYRAKKF